MTTVVLMEKHRNVHPSIVLVSSFTGVAHSELLDRLIDRIQKLKIHFCFFQNHRQVTVKQYEKFIKICQQWSDQSLHNQEDEDTINNLWNKTHRFTSNDQPRLIVEPYLSDSEKDLLCTPYRHHRQYRLIETDK